AGGAWTVRVPPEQDEEKQPLAGELVELRGMPPERIAGLREHHRPGALGGSPPELAVDEVAQTPGGKTDGHQGCDEVDHVPEWLAASPAIQPDRQDHAQQAAVEGHPPLPHREDLERMREVVARLVEEDVAEAAADDDAHRPPEQQVLELGRREMRARGAPGIAQSHPAEEVEGGECDEVHEAVPAHGERADLERDRVELRMDEHRAPADAPNSGPARSRQSTL